MLLFCMLFVSSMASLRPDCVRYSDTSSGKIDSHSSIGGIFACVPPC